MNPDDHACSLTAFGPKENEIPHSLSANAFIFNLRRYGEALGKAHERQFAAMAGERASGRRSDPNGTWEWFHAIPGLPWKVMCLAW